MQKHYNSDVMGFIIEDESLQRPYLAAVGTPKRIGKERYDNAQLLLQFLTSSEVQTMIRNFRLKDFSDTPVFFPIKVNRIAL